jgi:hypothetical protein
MRLRLALVVVLACGLVATAAGLATPQSPAAARDPLAVMSDEVSKEVEGLRGWTFKKPVPMQMATLAQVREHVARELDKSLPPDKARGVEAFLRTIGLIPRDADMKTLWLKVLESQVAGFYDPGTKAMRLVERGTTPPFVQRMLLSHELTHALDDQYVDLNRFLHDGDRQTEDLELASASVTEGSATSLMVQYMMRAQVSGRLDLAELQQYAQQEAEQSKVFLEAPRYFSVMLGSYLCGTGFLGKGSMMAVMAAPDNKGIGQNFLAAVKDPPQSTEQILHPDKYWKPEQRDDPVTIDDQAAAKWLAQPGRWIVHRDTVGEMLTAILTSPPGKTFNLASLDAASWTSPAAAGWGGDRFYLLASSASADEARKTLKNVKGVWVTTWDTPGDRDEFVAAAATGSLAPGASVQATGPAVAVVYFGFDESERDALTKRLQQAPLKMTKGDKPWQ